MANFDAILEVVGPLGRYQILHILLVGLFLTLPGLNNLANIFLVGVSEYWCYVPQLANLSAADRHQWMSTENQSVIPDDSCSLYELNYTEAAWAYVNNATFSVQNLTLEQCSQWGYDKEVFGETMVTKWNLVCSQSWKRALASSLFMLGYLLGCIVFGTMADRHGRKVAVFVSLPVMVISGVGASFAPEYWSHILFRMVTAAATAGAYTCGFVLAMESVGIQKRVLAGQLLQIGFTLGYVILAGLAYIFKDYMWLCLTLALVPIVFLPSWWAIGESPRWLILSNRLTEAQKEIRRICRMNGTKLTSTLALELESLCQEVRHEQEDLLLTRKYSIIDLLRTPNMRKKSLCVFFNWFVVSMVYYGLSLRSGGSGGPYLHLAIFGLVDIASLVAIVFILGRIGRRWPLAGLMLGTGVACLAIAFIPAQHKLPITILVMLGRLGMSCGFAVIYFYSAELFPTVVRSIGVGTGSMSARVGALLAPFLADLGEFAWEPLAMIIFGGSCITAGLLALLLPETLNMTLPDTLEQGEQFGKRERRRPRIANLTESRFHAERMKETGEQTI